MKKVMVFCIPAHGHHNPTLPVVTELVKRGNAVRYYSFEEFREKIEKTGAEFFPCDAFLPELTQEEEQLVAEYRYLQDDEKKRILRVVHSFHTKKY